MLPARVFFKKILTFVICFAILITAQAFATSADSSCIRGDINKDGRVNIEDATQLQRVLAQLSMRQLDERVADVDNNGLSISDVTNIQRYLAEYDNPFHIGSPADNVDVPQQYFYSSLSLALADANNFSSENSDVDSAENAAAILTVYNDEVGITLVKDSLNTPALEITNNVNLDLNKKTLGFSGLNGITFSANLTIANGNIIATGFTSLFYQDKSDTNSSIEFNNVNINAEFDGKETQDRLSVINVINSNVNLTTTTINANIINDKANHSYSLITESCSTENNILNSSFGFTSQEIVRGQIYGFDLKGKIDFLYSNVNIELSVGDDHSSNSLKRIYGVFCDGDIYSEKSTIYMNIFPSGNDRRNTSAFVNADSNNGETIINHTNVNINYNTNNSGIEYIYAVTTPYNGLIDIENSNFTILSEASAINLSNTKHVYGVYVAGIERNTVVLKNNDINLNCHLTDECTDSSYKIYQIGYYLNNARISSVGDVINCTTDTIYNNVIRSYAMNITDSESVEIDNIYAFVTSQPSYVPGSDGATSCIYLKSSTVSITDNHGENYVHGSNSGVSASGDNMHLTVHGGTYESPSHGGFYFTGANGSTMVLDRVKSFNTQNFSEHFDPELLGVQGALYISDFGCTASISNSYIYGGKFGLRIKYYQKFDENGNDTNTAHHADVTVDDTYIYGDYVGIHDDLSPGMGVLTIGKNTVTENGGLSPTNSYDVWTWRGADVVDYR